MTVRDFLTDVSNSLRSVSLDNFIPPKWLYLKAQSIISDFIKKDNSSNKLLYKLSTGWSSLDCIDMIEVPVTSCDIDVYLCQKLMRSKYKLPDVYQTKFGALIREVTTIDYSASYEPVFSPRLWKNTQLREFKSKKYYFIIDNYLYIPIPKGDSSTPEKITAQIYPKNLKDVDVFNSFVECQSCKEQKSICASILDYEMVVPDYLESDVKKEVLNQILQSYGKLVPDELPNLNKNQTTK